jgi:hypothetical protein
MAMRYRPHDRYHLSSINDCDGGTGISLAAGFSLASGHFSTDHLHRHADERPELRRLPAATSIFLSQPPPAPFGRVRKAGPCTLAE